VAGAGETTVGRQNPSRRSIDLLDKQGKTTQDPDDPDGVAERALAS
jgi:hypothetical protein